MDRRSFVKALGFSNAIVPLADATGKELPTTVHCSDPVPLGRPGRAFEWLNVSPEWLYSGATVTPYEMQDIYRLFLDPMQTYAMSNIEASCMLLMPQAFGVEKVGVLFAPGSLPAVRNRFIECYWLELWIAQRRYFRAPLSGLFQVGVLDMLDEQANQAIKGFAELEVPVIIPPACPFNVTIRGENFRTSNKLNFWAVLRGRNGRAIQ